MNEDVIALMEKIRTAIWSAFVAWAFTPILCRLVRYGEITLTIHDERLKDVHVNISTREITTARK